MSAVHTVFFFTATAILSCHAIKNPHCTDSIIENYKCNMTNEVPQPVLQKWNTFCQLFLCYQFENVSSFTESWESFSNLNALDPCDLTPFSDLEIAAICIFLFITPTIIGAFIYCESQPINVNFEESSSLKSHFSVQTV